MDTKDKLNGRWRREKTEGRADTEIGFRDGEERREPAGEGAAKARAREEAAGEEEAGEARARADLCHHRYMVLSCTKKFFLK